MQTSPSTRATPTLVGVLLAACVLLFGPSTAGAAPASPQASAPSSTGSLLIASHAQLAANPKASEGAYVVLQPWEFAQIPRLRRANPDLTILMYENMSATYRDVCRDSCTKDKRIEPSGVGYHDAMAHHPDWFLRSASGTPLEWADYPGMYPMDTGLAAYQRAWGDRVLRVLRSHDWDGVLIDDTLTYLSHPTVDDLTSTQIPTDAAQHAATASFLRHVATRIKRARYLAVPNVTLVYDNWRTTLKHWTGWVSGWENEHFVKWGNDASEPDFTATNDWTWKMQMSAWLADRDEPLLAVTYSSAQDHHTQTYHRATFLLTWNGRTGASIFVPTDPAVAQSLPDASVSIGRPTGRRTLHGGVYRRTYAGGLVLVNPTSTSHTVRVGPGYRTADGHGVRRLVLAPTSAAILRR